LSASSLINLPIGIFPSLLAWIEMTHEKFLYIVTHHICVVKTCMCTMERQPNTAQMYRPSAWVLTGQKKSDDLFRCPCMNPADPEVDFLSDGIGIDRLGDIIIHADMKALVRIAFDGIGGHCDDGNPTVGFV
jgi:hypothetical protein